jgi:hypothetical protein
LALFLLSGVLFAAVAAEPSRTPVLVELFTSEGCSSCPPADRLLEQLDPHVIVLSEHVDYWNHLGWKDPFSSAQFTQRQETYERQLGVNGPYTPQMVVDGAAELNGSDGPRARAEIAKAARGRKASVRLTRSDSGIDIHIADADRAGSVYLVLAENAASSQVAAGENKGKQLHHVAIVRSMKKIGTVKRGEAFDKLVELPHGAPGQRVVVFVQDSDQGQVRGAAVLE